MKNMYSMFLGFILVFSLFFVGGPNVSASSSELDLTVNSDEITVTQAELQMYPPNRSISLPNAVIIQVGASTLIWTEKLRSRTLDLKQMRSSNYDKAGTPYIHARVQKTNGAAVPEWKNKTSHY